MLRVQVLQEYDEVRAADPSFSTQVGQRLSVAEHVRSAAFFATINRCCYRLVLRHFGQHMPSGSL